MLYDYKFSLSQMGQIKNYKRDNNFNHTLLNIEDIELSTYEVDCNIKYKQTIPLNMFEKYSIRLIQKANEIYTDMNIAKIASLLQLDEKLIKENLENLEQIDMLNGVNSDIITINHDENSAYLQYENKFKLQSDDGKFSLTKDEYENIEEYIKKEFEKDKNNNDKKFESMNISQEQESSKEVKMLLFSDNQFLLYSKDGINNQNDLKFVQKDTIEIKNAKLQIPDNIFCHYDEFLPLLRDKIALNSKELIVIGSKSIDENNLEILKAQKNKDDVFILSNSNIKHRRIFDIYIEDFVLIGDSLYLKKDEFIVKIKDKQRRKTIKEKLENYFQSKILEIEPKYNFVKLREIDGDIDKLESKINKLHHSTSKEFDNEIKSLNTQKNELYGLAAKNAQARNKKRKEIDKLEELDNQKELKNYPTYLQNRDDIFDLKDKVANLEKQKNELKNILGEIQQLQKKKKELISADNRDRIKTIENEIDKLARIKI